MPAGLSTALDRPTFVVNRNAGRFRRHPELLDGIARTVGGRGTVIATSSVAELGDAIGQLMGSGFGPLALCGGDGTYLAGLTALTRIADGRTLPPVVLVRAGTVSIAARNWGSQSDPLATVRRVCERPSTLELTPRPTLSVDAGDGPRVGFTFGTGLVARFFQEYEGAGAGGYRTAAAIALRVFLDSFRGGGYASSILSPLPCRVTADGRLLDAREFSLVLASVLRDVGMHMLVTHRGGEDSKRPHLVASSLPPRMLGPQWPRVALGRPLVGRGNFDSLVSSFTVEFPDECGPYIVDGDAFRSKRVTVRAGPVIEIGV